VLLQNIDKLKIDPLSINTVFISHNHFDHIGGLSEFLNINNSVVIYSPPSLRGIRNAEKVIYLDKPTQISVDVFSTGELEGIEQSMLVKTTKGLIIIAGCSHPNMKKILKAAHQFGEIYGIIGGLHDFNQFDLFKNFKLICATHCTTNKLELQSFYPQQFIEGGTGQVIEVN
jgi:7,8-dihydropterin-6-yl-methyl-4-(beta-D-ribofuranosyl)aminobenzene 5'-phosphate synthase